MTNEFQNVDIEDVNIEVETTMQRNEAELLEVWLDRNEVRPGETVNLKAMYRPLHGEKKFEEFAIKIPDRCAAQSNLFYGWRRTGTQPSRICNLWQSLSAR